MSIESYLSKIESPKGELLSAMHAIIVSNDKTAVAEVGKMMGKDMIIYKSCDVFKYGLASTKNYMSFHSMPIYATAQLHEKYSKLLPKATFQKGCINFKSGDQMPLTIFKDLVADCAKIDMKALMERWQSARKS
jgi:hypothetical protein